MAPEFSNDMPERVLGKSPSREETDMVRTVRKLPRDFSATG